MEIDKQREIETIANRHTARTCTDLEDIKCPRGYVVAVRAAMRDIKLTVGADGYGDSLQGYCEARSAALLNALAMAGCLEVWIDVARAGLRWLTDDLVAALGEVDGNRAGV